MSAATSPDSRRRGTARELLRLGFWLDPAHRTAPTWREHRDIHTVMLAATLAPVGTLGPVGTSPTPTGGAGRP